VPDQSYKLRLKQKRTHHVHQGSTSMKDLFFLYHNIIVFDLFKKIELFRYNVMIDVFCDMSIMFANS